MDVFSFGSLLLVEKVFFSFSRISGNSASFCKALPVAPPLSTSRSNDAMSFRSEIRSIISKRGL